MPEQLPVKYEQGGHRPFAPDDTLPSVVLALLQRIRPGLGIEIIDNGDGTLTIQNSCCDTPPPNGSAHTLTMTPVLANILEGNDACWTVTLNAPVAGAPLNIAFALAGDEQSAHSYPAPTATFAIGAQSATVCVPTLDDAIDEPIRLLILQPVFTQRLTGWMPPGNHIDTIHVLDNDGGGDAGYTIVSMTPPSATIIEGRAACWDIVLDRAVTQTPLTVSLAFSGDEQAQHAYPTPTLTIPVGAFGGPVCVITIDDTVVEADRSLTLTAFTDALISAVPAPSTITVRDNDSTIVPPGIPPGAFTESGGTCFSTAGGRIEESVVFELNGDIYMSTSLAIGGIVGNWLGTSPFNPADFEVYCASNNDGDPQATWLSLGSRRVFIWFANDANGSGPDSKFCGGRIRIRRISDGALISDEAMSGDQLVSGAECP